MVAWQPDGMVAWQPDGMVAWQPDGMVAWWPDGLTAWAWRRGCVRHLSEPGRDGPADPLS
jgi:hypothetical protein